MLLHYIIYQNGTEIQRVMGNVTSYVVTGLQPFSVYVFKLGVCTKEGCSNSSDSTPQRTLESGMSSFIRLTCDCISAINHRFLRLTAKDIIPTMSHNSAKTLRSKIRFSSFLERVCLKHEMAKCRNSEMAKCRNGGMVLKIRAKVVRLPFH